MIGVILLVVAVIGLLVFVHELGHFVMARRNGVAVEEFGFGFPPRLFGRRIGPTVYSVNLLPLGGFVRLKGEDAADTGPDSFNAASYGTKAKILLAGVGMNALAAYGLLLYLTLTGLPPMFAGQFSFGQPQVAQPKRLIVAETVPGSPADAAGIKAGDYILSGNNQPFLEASDLTGFTKSHAGQEVTLTVKQGTAQRDVRVKLREPGSDQGFLGVSPLQTYQIKYSPFAAVVVSAGLLLQLLGLTVAAIVGLLLQIPFLIIGLFASGVPKAAEAAVGPLGIVFLTKNISTLGLNYLVQFAMSISVALAAFNALPIPALDGGRLALISYQQVTKRKLSVGTESLIHAVGFIFLILFMVMITVFDFRRFF
ncbi:site-2 protease family protein [Candidatus Parcubacteria bacterium]|nr:site-2 protease family protein [Candidatus Parcubacteria bacterium]